MTAQYSKATVNGADVYTNIETGATGASANGLAKMCGVTHTAINKRLKVLETSDGETDLNANNNGLLYLDTNDVVNGKKAGNLRIVPAALCIDFISYYAKKGNEVAIASLMQTARMGFDAWVHAQTGYQRQQLHPTEKMTDVVSTVSSDEIQQLFNLAQSQQISIRAQQTNISTQQANIDRLMPFMQERVAIQQQVTSGLYQGLSGVVDSMTEMPDKLLPSGEAYTSTEWIERLRPDLEARVYSSGFAREISAAYVAATGHAPPKPGTRQVYEVEYEPLIRQTLEGYVTRRDKRIENVSEQLGTRIENGDLWLGIDLDRVKKDSLLSKVLPLVEKTEYRDFQSDRTGNAKEMSEHYGFPVDISIESLELSALLDQARIAKYFRYRRKPAEYSAKKQPWGEVVYSYHDTARLEALIVAYWDWRTSEEYAPAAKNKAAQDKQIADLEWQTELDYTQALYDSYTPLGAL